jgi:streptomycin 6-kinase
MNSGASKRDPQGSVYIAGPMTHIEAFNFPAFFEAEERWAQAGWIVINPARLDANAGFDPENDEPETSEAYMKRDLPKLANCDAIALLPGWRESRSALKEHQVARWCGLFVYDAVTMALLPNEIVRQWEATA